MTLNPNNNFESTSYINASPITYTLKQNHDLSFIIAQSPLKHTINTFWQMVWENNVTVVAMLTKLKVRNTSTKYKGDAHQFSKIFTNPSPAPRPRAL